MRVPLQLVVLVAQLILFSSTGGLALDSKTESCDGSATGDASAAKEGNYCEATRRQKVLDSGKNDCFRAAVVDYSRIDGRTHCSESSGKNLDVYEKIAKIARENRVQMLVFSEDGILYGSERYVQPCLEEIPDPELSPDYNPCLQPERFNQSFPILTRLSCLARDNGLYVVANYGTKQKRTCLASKEGCAKVPTPKKGSFGDYLMLNTDVVLDPTGKFIRRYRKWHPFVFTEMFAKAPELEHVYFDTEFGRFGVFTCFDMLFKQPAIDLVERHNIDTVVFPTYWFDEVPILPAVQYQDGWSSANQVNLLASNILKPRTGSIGSSIFSGNRSLYLTPVPDVRGGTRKTTILISTIQARRSAPDSKSPACAAKPNPHVIEIEDNANSDVYKNMDYKILDTDTIVGLTGAQDTKSVCSGKVCCTVDYELDSSDQASLELVNKVVILVRDSLRSSGWYEQVCTLATLTKPYANTKTSTQVEINSPLIEPIFDSHPAVSFKRLSLRAIFSTRYVFPTCAHNITRLVERDQRQMHCDQSGDSDGETKHICELNYTPARADPESNKLYSFGMYGRVYERDQKDL